MQCLVCWHDSHAFAGASATATYSSFVPTESPYLSLRAYSSVRDIKLPESGSQMNGGFIAGGPGQAFRSASGAGVWITGRVDSGLFKMVELTVTVSGGQAYVHASAARWAPAPASVTASTVNAASESGTPARPVTSAGGSGYGVSALVVEKPGLLSVCGVPFCLVIQRSSHATVQDNLEGSSR